MSLSVRLSHMLGRARLPALAPQPARGVADRSNPGIRTIVVRVDVATFARIALAATAAGVSVSEALRQLIKRGLDASAASGGE